MKSLKEEGSKVEKVDVVDGKGQKPQWGMPLNLSPSQMLMGRRLGTLIPVTEDMLKPQLYDPEELLPKLEEKQRKQKLQHDTTAKELPPLRNGEVRRQQVETCYSYTGSSLTQIVQG
ncbi:unnamed protein product [Porites evermanni]|uniref:Uncharacterized protein n=1 Tax=Porites evermanni TaxID=104178 RepID=A0ABN8N2I0_9CNID|nr:unnamed protein product [Porites evermanni]